MACTLDLSEIEPRQVTLARWEKIYSIFKKEQLLAKEMRGLKSFETTKKEKLKKDLRELRGGKSEALLALRKTHYTEIEKFILYLYKDWEISFEVYQVLEFIFRATIESHDRKLFTYHQNYSKVLVTTDSPEVKYRKIKDEIKRQNKKGIFALEDIRPTKTEYVDNLNRELERYKDKINQINTILSDVRDLPPSFQGISAEINKAAEEFGDWAIKKVIGEENNRGFLAFHEGKIVMKHSNFLYFKIYILAFMGTYGEFISKIHPRRASKISQLAEKKLNFESAKHFEGKVEMTSRFLSSKERFAKEDREVESIAQERGYLDDKFLDFLVEVNEKTLTTELPFNLIK